MADETPVFSASGSPTLVQLVDYFVEQLHDPVRLERVAHAQSNAAARGAVVADSAITGAVEKVIGVALEPVLLAVLKALLAALRGAEPLIDDIGKLAVDTVLGERPHRGFVPDDVGKRLLEKIAPPAGAVQPGIDGAHNYINTMTHLRMESWLLGFVTELVAESADLIRGAGGHIQSVSELGNVVTQILGGDRIARRVIGPFVDAGIVTPARWYTNKQYRPELLSVSAALDAFIAGRISDEEIREELARQGWSDHRIEVMLQNARKQLALTDLFHFYWRGGLSDVSVVERARELGYRDDVTYQLLAIEQQKRKDQWRGGIVDAAVAAFVAREIEEGELRALVEGNVGIQAESQFIIDAAKTRRGYRRRHLSSAEEREMIKDGISAFIDYRHALEREGYTPEAVTKKELALRVELQKDRDVEKARAEQAAERQREKDEAAAARVAREADVAARKALPALAEFRRAYVRGFIGLDRFIEAIRREKIAIADTDVQLLVQDADADREEYLVQLERRAAAEQRAHDPGLSIAELEAAVLEGVLSLSDFDARMAQREFDDDERRILTSLLEARIKDRDDALAKREEAAARAELAGVSLSAFEQAVRLGVRSFDDYAAWLGTIGMNDVARALILDLLSKQLELDAATRAKRDALDAAGDKKGISIAQRRRVVVEGVRPRAYYEQALIEAGWPVDDQLAELALVDLEIEAAAAARARRDELATQAAAKRAAELAAEADAARRGEPWPPPKTLSLGQYERAFILGLLSPAEFRAAAARLDIGAKDIDLLVRLATAKVPDARAGAAREAAIADELAERHVSLGDFKRAVKAGLRTLDDFAAMLTGEHYGADDVALLRALLDHEIALDAAKARERVAASLAKREDAPLLDELVAAWRAGEIDAVEFAGILELYGVAGDVARVLVRALDAGLLED